MRAPNVGQKVRIREHSEPYFDVDGRYKGLRPVYRVGTFVGEYHGYKMEPQWTFSVENDYSFSTCVGNDWEPVE